MGEWVLMGGVFVGRGSDLDNGGFAGFLRGWRVGWVGRICEGCVGFKRERKRESSVCS